MNELQKEILIRITEIDDYMASGDKESAQIALKDLQEFVKSLKIEPTGNSK